MNNFTIDYTEMFSAYGEYYYTFSNIDVVFDTIYESDGEYRIYNSKKRYVYKHEDFIDPSQIIDIIKDNADSEVFDLSEFYLTDISKNEKELLRNLISNFLNKIEKKCEFTTAINPKLKTIYLEKLSDGKYKYKVID